MELRSVAGKNCEVRYQPEDWDRAYRFIAFRYQKKEKPREELILLQMSA